MGHTQLGIPVSELRKGKGCEGPRQCTRQVVADHIQFAQGGQFPQRFRQHSGEPVVAEVEARHPADRVGLDPEPLTQQRVAEPPDRIEPLTAASRFMERGQGLPVALCTIGSVHLGDPLSPFHERLGRWNAEPLVATEIDHTQVLEMQETVRNGSREPVVLQEQSGKLRRTPQFYRYRSGELVVREAQVLQLGKVSEFQRERSLQSVGGECQPHHQSRAVRDHPVPLVHRRVGQPVLATVPIRAVRRVVQCLDGGPVPPHDVRFRNRLHHPVLAGGQHDNQGEHRCPPDRTRARAGQVAMADGSGDMSCVAHGSCLPIRRVLAGCRARQGTTGGSSCQEPGEWPLFRDSPLYARLGNGVHLGPGRPRARP